MVIIDVSNLYEYIKLLLYILESIIKHPRPVSSFCDCSCLEN